MFWSASLGSFIKRQFGSFGGLSFAANINRPFGFRLLSDADKTVAKAYGVKRMGPLPTKRQTFVIDVDGTLLHTTAGETSMDKHADEALEVLRARA